MSVTPIPPSAAPLPAADDDVIPEDVDIEQIPEQLSPGERRKQSIDENKRYIWDQMMRSTQRFTQEMIRQAREREREDA